MLKKNCYNRNDSIFTIKTKNFKKVYARITGISAFSKHAIMQFVDNDWSIHICEYHLHSYYVLSYIYTCISDTLTGKSTL